MPFLGAYQPTARLTLPDGTVRYVQAPDDQSAYAALVALWEAERERFTEGQVRVEVVWPRVREKE